MPPHDPNFISHGGLRVIPGDVEMINFHVGGRADVALPIQQPHTVQELGNGSEYRVWMNGDEWACDCGQSECIHRAAVITCETYVWSA